MASKMLQFEEDDNPQSDLERLIAGVEDVTDPSSMDKVLEYLEEIQEEDDNFIEVLTQNLKDADIYWEQPWYQKISRIGRPHKSVNENETTSNRTDTICKEEHDVIVKNWHKLRKKYNLPDKLICLARWKNYDKSKNPKKCPEEQARRFAIAYLARGLERNSYQVFKHIFSYYAGHRRGLYSTIEQKIIEICFHHKPKFAASVLSSVLGREPRGIYQTLGFKLDGKREKKRLKWNLPLASKLLQLLLKYSNLDLEELKNRKLEKWIWRRVEEDMGQNDMYLQRFWYSSLHVQLFVKSYVKLNKLRKKVFKKLRTKARDSTYKIWSDIRWKDLTLEFPDGFTPWFLYKICTTLMRDFKGYLRVPLETAVDYALQKMKKQKRLKNNKRLKTLSLNKEGELEVLYYRD